MENYYFNERNGLFITINGWEKIFKENGLSIKTSASAKNSDRRLFI